MMGVLKRREILNADVLGELCEHENCHLQVMDRGLDDIFLSHSSEGTEPADTLISIPASRTVSYQGSAV